MAININDFIKNAVFLNDNVVFKIEENCCYVYPYGDENDKQYYIFDFDEKSISEKGIYINYDIISNAIIEEKNKRFYIWIIDTGKRIEEFSGILKRGGERRMNDAFFEKALAQTLKNEGVLNGKTGYVNAKTDSGGETNYGITKAKARECGYKGKMCDLPKEKAVAIYKNEYWIKSGANRVAELSFNIAFLLFDFAVNSGVGNAVKKIQKVFNEKYAINPKLAIDGVFGNKTLNAFNTLQSYKKDNEFIFIEFEKYYISEILKYYTSLKNPNTGFTKNGAGWVNRVANNIDFLNGILK